jgi:branched-chain amino acid transport system substrate-binding protein
VRRLIALAVAALAALALAPLASASTYQIAVEAPLTGPQGASGMDMLRGAKLAVREINQAGGVLGMKWATVGYNDKADGATGVMVAKRILDSHVNAMVGPYNSSVGVKVLPMLVDGGVFPLQLTSTDDTTGLGATVQPKNSQISPAEVDWMKAHQVGKVSILWDPSTYTKGMADRMYKALDKMGVLVTKIQIDPTATDFTDVVAQALTNNPDTVYVSTYYPQGALIGKALAAQAAQGNDARCFMGLANQEQAFIDQAGVAAAKRCAFSGSPTPTQFGNAQSKAYVKAYKALYGVNPGTWGIYYYDSVKLLAASIAAAGTTERDAFEAEVLGTTGYMGATGPITIDPKTGNRPNVPIAILGVSAKGRFTLQSIHT